MKTVHLGDVIELKNGVTLKAVKDNINSAFCRECYFNNKKDQDDSCVPELWSIDRLLGCYDENYSFKKV